MITNSILKDLIIVNKKQVAINLVLKNTGYLSQLIAWFGQLSMAS